MSGMPDDDFTLQVAPSLDNSDSRLSKFGAAFTDLTTFWPSLAERLADDAQSRWPLQRRTGKLRRPLTWIGKRLGRAGVYKPSRDWLVFGTNLFYARFAHHGTQRQRETPLVHVNEADITKRLTEWARERAVAAGLEVE